MVVRLYSQSNIAVLPIKFFNTCLSFGNSSELAWMCFYTWCVSLLALKQSHFGGWS